nr:MAG TPA: hypothetical protein [Caudoviricetes sp.]
MPLIKPISGFSCSDRHFQTFQSRTPVPVPSPQNAAFNSNLS